MRFALALAAGLALAACTASEETPSATGETFDAIAESETIFLTGTEPFWSAEIAAGYALYRTPEDSEGVRFQVQRFAGLNGIGFSGAIAESSFDLTVTPGECSDAMSDRTYPYTATLLIGGEQRSGCAWTDSQPFTGPETP